MNLLLSSCRETKADTEPGSVSELHESPGSMLRTREHLGGCFMDSNAFFFLWLFEFEQLMRADD